MSSHLNTNLKLVEKPWGHEEWWALNEKYCAKILYIKHGHRLSLQYHEVKQETMRVMSGVLTFTYGSGASQETLLMRKGDVIHVPPSTVHRMEARDGDVYVIEVSTPEVDDVVRVSDDYGR